MLRGYYGDFITAVLLPLSIKLSQAVNLAEHLPPSFLHTQHTPWTEILQTCCCSTITAYIWIICGWLMLGFDCYKYFLCYSCVHCSSSIALIWFAAGAFVHLSLCLFFSLTDLPRRNMSFQHYHMPKCMSFQDCIKCMKRMFVILCMVLSIFLIRHILIYPW